MLAHKPGPPHPLASLLSKHSLAFRAQQRSRRQRFSPARAGLGSQGEVKVNLLFDPALSSSNNYKLFSSIPGNS